MGILTTQPAQLPGLGLTGQAVAEQQSEDQEAEIEKSYQAARIMCFESPN